MQAVAQDSRIRPTTTALRNLFINVSDNAAKHALDCAKVAYTPEARTSFLAALSNCELDGLMRHPQVQRWALGALAAGDINLSQYATLILFSTPFRSFGPEVVKVRYTTVSQQGYSGAIEEAATIIGLEIIDWRTFVGRTAALQAWERSVMHLEFSTTPAIAKDRFGWCFGIAETEKLLRSYKSGMSRLLPDKNQAFVSLPTLSIFEIGLKTRFPSTAPTIVPEIGLCSRSRYAVHARRGNCPISLAIDDVPVNCVIHNYRPNAFLMTIHDIYHAFRRAPIPTLLRNAALRVHDIMARLEANLIGRTGGESDCVLPIGHDPLSGPQWLEVKKHHLLNDNSYSIREVMIDLEFEINPDVPFNHALLIVEFLVSVCDAQTRGALQDQVPLVAVVLDMAQNPNYWREKVGIEPLTIVERIAKDYEIHWLVKIFNDNLPRTERPVDRAKFASAPPIRLFT